MKFVPGTMESFYAPDELKNDEYAIYDCISIRYHDKKNVLTLAMKEEKWNLCIWNRENEKISLPDSFDLHCLISVLAPYFTDTEEMMQVAMHVRQCRRELVYKYENNTDGGNG